MAKIVFTHSFRQKGVKIMYDIQKASILKRVSAFLLDFILMTIALTGFALLLSTVFGYDNYVRDLNQKREEYETVYIGEELIKEGVTFDIEKDKYDALDEDTRKILDDAYALFQKDRAVIFNYNMLFNLTLTIASLSIVISYLVVEFMFPMIFGNGQTVGKKIFGIGVVHENAVKITGVAAFTRAILGKCVIETMIPIMVAITIFSGNSGIVGLIVLGLILFLEIFVFFKEKKGLLIHDVIAHTVTVDLSTQLIFETPEELAEYTAKKAAQKVAESNY